MEEMKNKMLYYKMLAKFGTFTSFEEKTGIPRHYMRRAARQGISKMDAGRACQICGALGVTVEDALSKEEVNEPAK